jgi:multicomponent Na+:H+ antiporter subunit G
MIQGLGVVLLLSGAGFMLVASIGVMRLPDLFMRMHAMTKAGTVGIGLTMLAVAIFSANVAVTSRAIVVILFVALTAPVAAHMIARAAYITGVRLWEGTFVDELREYRHTQKRRRSAGESA